MARTVNRKAAMIAARVHQKVEPAPATRSSVFLAMAWLFAAFLSREDFRMDVAGNRGSDQDTTIVPELSVRRGRAAIEFYKVAFGAVEDYRVAGTDDHP